MVKLASLAKEFYSGGGSPEEWNILQGEDLPLGIRGVYFDASRCASKLPSFVEATLKEGRFIEYECFDDSWSSQGKAVVMISSMSSVSSRGLKFTGRHLGASDQYYEYWMECTSKVDKCKYHLCVSDASRCKEHKKEASDIVHVANWRVLTAAEIWSESRYAWEGLEKVIHEAIETRKKQDPEDEGEAPGKDKGQASGIEAFPGKRPKVPPPLPPPSSPPSFDGGETPKGY